MTEAPTGMARRFLVPLSLIVGGWCLLGTLYALRFPLIADEFQGAHSVGEFLGGLPYRDFRPYKTVLGYLVQLPVVAAFEDPWTAVLGVRVEMVLIGGIALFLTGMQLSRRHAPGAVLGGLALLVGSATFAESAGELRVDMLTAWVGLGSLLLLLSGRWGWAGVAAACSFLVSQKGAYFVLAGGAALAVLALARRDRSNPRAVALYAGAGAATGLTYLLLWGLVSSPGEVLRTVFVGPAQLASGDVYRDIPAALRWSFWGDALRGAPALFLVAGTGLLVAVRSLAGRGGGGETEMAAGVSRDAARLLSGYGITLLALYLTHRQPWPYYLATLTPTLAVLSVVGLEAIGRSQRLTPIRSGVLAAIAGLTLLPLLDVPDNLAWRNDHQGETVRRVEALLEPGDRYLAGVNLLPRGTQAPSALGWLDRRRTAWLFEASESERAGIVEELREDPPKLFVLTAQLSGIPMPLQEVLLSDFLPWEPYIYLYAPTVGEADSVLTPAFEGRYRIEGDPEAILTLDGAPNPVGSTITLGSRAYSAAASEPVRLRYLPGPPPSGPSDLPPIPFFSRAIDGGITTWAGGGAG